MGIPLEVPLGEVPLEVPLWEVPMGEVLLGEVPLGEVPLEVPLGEVHLGVPPVGQVISSARLTISVCHWRFLRRSIWHSFESSFENPTCWSSDQLELKCQ